MQTVPLVVTHLHNPAAGPLYVLLARKIFADLQVIGEGADVASDESIVVLVRAENLDTFDEPFEAFADALRKKLGELAAA